MIVQPKTSQFNETRIRVTGTTKFGIFIECEGTRPKSFEGKTVTLFVDAETATSMLKVFRDYCISIRNKAENAEE